MSIGSEVRQVEVDDDAMPGYHYADAFEVAWAEADSEEPVQWMSRGARDLPPLVRWVQRRLGFREPSIVESTHDLVRKDLRLPAMRVSIVGRNLPGRRRMTMSFIYVRPVLGRLAWAMIGYLHRRMTRRIITSKPPAALGLEGGERA